MPPFTMEYVAERVYIRKQHFTKCKVADALTVKYRGLGEKEYRVVEPWEDCGDYVGVPRAYGLQLIATLGVTAEDRMSYGYKRKYPKAVEHTGQYTYQQPFVERMLSLARSKTDFLISAATGKGKTVLSLSLIQKLGVNAVIVVDQNNLLEQWIDRAQTALGLAREQIGVVQGNRCDYKKKHIVVAMVQSLVRRDYPEEFYRYFGVAVFDEVHTTGAPTFSRVLSAFSAAVRFGVSATVDRRDPLQKLLHFNLGEVDAELTDKHDTSYVYYLESDTVYSWYANISPKTGRILSEVAEDTNRNCLIVEAVKWLYDSGRDVLVLSDRIEQLEALLCLTEAAGVTPQDLGLYCGYRNVWGFQKDATPKRRPIGWEKHTEYTPVKYGVTAKKIPKKEKDRVLAESRVIFATYGMFAKGLDVPRLSGGIDCTPRSRAEQVHGRILRVKDGKPVPIWVTIRDINSYRIDHQFANRITEYAASSAEIYLWRPDKGIRKQNVAELVRLARKNVNELKRLNIEMQQDGNYMLTTPSTPRE